MPNQVWRVAAAATLLSVVTSGCQTAVSEDGDSASLRIGVAAPALAAQRQIALQYHRNALTRDTLVTIGDDGRAVPRVIQSWNGSPDGLQWRLKIRTGVRYHDGTALSATDLAPQVGPRLTRASAGAVTQVIAESADTLLVTLREPYSFLFEDLAIITPQRVVGDQSYGTGPYLVAEETPERVVLRAATDHYRGPPSIDMVDVRLYPDQRNAWSALMRDQVDMLYQVNSDSLEFVRSESSIRVATFPRPYVYVFALNLNHAALADIRVRRALDLAVDREALVRLAMAGEGDPASGHVWPAHWAYDARASAVRHDPAEARRLMDEAGLSLQQEPGRMPARLRIKCLVHEPLQKMALVLQRQLAEADVELQLEMPPTEQFLQRLGAGDFQSFVFEVASARGLKWPYEFWHSTSPYLKHGYKGADDVLDQMRNAGSESELKAAASAFQRRMHEDPPAIFLAWGRISRAVTRRFDVPAGEEEDIFHSIPRWTTAKGR